MPRGPKGQWRPPGDIACAVHVGKIATGEIEDSEEPPPSYSDDMEQRRARKGGKARAASLSTERRSEIASKAASARWNP